MNEGSITEFKKNIIFCGRRVVLSCDGQCNKAWGRNSRPRNGDDEIPDAELGEAPADPGTYEGGDAKPNSPAGMNKWRARECERSHIQPIGEGSDE